MSTQGSMPICFFIKLARETRGNVRRVVVPRDVLFSTVDIAVGGRCPRAASVPQRQDHVVVTKLIVEVRIEDAGPSHSGCLCLILRQIFDQPFVHPTRVHSRQYLAVLDGRPVVGLP